MKKIIIDLDNTLTIEDPKVKYEDKKPNIGMIKKLMEYKNENWEIIIFTSRNMNTYNGNIDLIRTNSLPIIKKWLAEHDVPYDKIILGKPWPGRDGFYIDDKSIRPKEFLKLTSDQISSLLKQ